MSPTPTKVAALRVGDAVRILPETFPDSGRSTVCNARVIKFDEKDEMVALQSIEDEFSPDSFPFVLPVEKVLSLPRVDVEEIKARSTLWHRQHVVYVHRETRTWT